MNISPRERFLDICHFKRPGELWLKDFFWQDTLEEWVKHGAPKEIVPTDEREQISGTAHSLDDYFQQDTWRWLAGDFGRRRNSKYKPRIISEDEHSIIYINSNGQTVKSLKGVKGMPMYLDWPVKDRTTWNEYKKRLDPNNPELLPADWDDLVQQINSESKPVALPVGSFYGYLREWVGTENILYMFYDDPGLIEDMMDQVLYLETEVIKRVLKDIKIDMATFWEDMAYKAGPLISPAMVRKFMMPRYKKVTDLLHSYGVDVIFVDSDGNVEQLVPLWLEVGINYVWPFEVAAGNDVVAMRKKYSRDLIIGGGIDKRALIKGKEAIREEVMSKVPFLLEQGGYFPSVDHYVPPDVTFENYCYFVNLLREVGGLEKLSF